MIRSLFPGVVVSGFLAWLVAPCAHSGEAEGSGSDPGGAAETQVQREEGSRAWIKLLMERRDHAAAIAAAKEYLADERFATARGRGGVKLHLAMAHDATGDLDEAEMGYAEVWVRHTGEISVSSPAVKRWMEILWQRNRPTQVAPDGKTIPADRQGAYQGGATYIEITSRPGLLNQMTSEERGRWNEVARLVATYAAEPGIITLEQQRQESRKHHGWRFDPPPLWYVWGAMGSAGIVLAIVWERRRAACKRNKSG